MILFTVMSSNSYDGLMGRAAPCFACYEPKNTGAHNSAICIYHKNTNSTVQEIIKISCKLPVIPVI
jgi:hypothetical protein